jgi:hypothetical protein
MTKTLNFIQSDSIVPSNAGDKKSMQIKTACFCSILMSQNPPHFLSSARLVTATWPIPTRTDNTCSLPQFIAVSVTIGITSDKHHNKSHAPRLIWIRRVTAKGIIPHKEPATMRRTVLGGCSAAKWYWRVTDQLSVGECRPRSYITTTSDTVQL